MKWYQMRWAQKYWGKEARERYRRYLPRHGKQSEKRFYKPPDSVVVGVAHPQQKYITRHTSESTMSDCQI
jgi:hypothetical protein